VVQVAAGSRNKFRREQPRNRGTNTCTCFWTASSSFLESVQSVLLISQSLYSRHVINKNATLTCAVSQPVNHLETLQQQASPTLWTGMNSDILSILYDLDVVEKAIVTLHECIARLLEATPSVHVAIPPLHEIIPTLREQWPTKT
jgi:hypothetical protein